MPVTKNHNATMGVPRTMGIHSGIQFSEIPQYYEEQLLISGITKDSTGAVLANCVVKVFETATDRLLQSSTSDGSGAYSCIVGRNITYYVVAYKAGAPDVSGTSVNTLVGA